MTKEEAAAKAKELQRIARETFERKQKELEKDQEASRIRQSANITRQRATDCETEDGGG